MIIKEVLRKRGVSSTELAEKLGVSAPAVSRMINGNPTADTLERIATAIGVSAADFFERPASSDCRCPACGAKLALVLTAAELVYEQ